MFNGIIEVAHRVCTRVCKNRFEKNYLKWSFFVERATIFERHENSDDMEGIVRFVVGKPEEEDSARSKEKTWEKKGT